MSDLQQPQMHHSPKCCKQLISKAILMNGIHASKVNQCGTCQLFSRTIFDIRQHWTCGDFEQASLEKDLEY